MAANRPASPGTAADPDSLRFLRYVEHGDHAALEDLLRAHLERAAALSLRITGDADAAQEAVQDACLRLVATAARYRGGVAFGAWWTCLVVAAATDRRRRLARERRRRAHPSPILTAAPALDRLEAGDVVQAAVDRLPTRFREVVQLVYFLDWTPEQAAAALALPSGTVASRLSRARERLRRSLAGTDLAIAQGCWAVAAALVPGSSASPASPAPPAARALAEGVAAIAHRSSPRAFRHWGSRFGSLAATFAALTVAVAVLTGMDTPAATPRPAATPPIATTPGPEATPVASTLPVTWLGQTPFLASSEIYACACSPDSREVAFATNKGLEVWDLRTRTRRWRILPREMFRAVFYRPDGQVVALVTHYGNQPGQILLVDPHAGTSVILATPSVGLSAYQPATLSPNGRWLVTARFDETQVHVWDLSQAHPIPETMDVSGTLKGQCLPDISAVAFSPDGTQLAISATNGVGIWSWPTRALIASRMVSPLTTDELSWAPAGGGVDVGLCGDNGQSHPVTMTLPDLAPRPRALGIRPSSARDLGVAIDTERGVLQLRGVQGPVTLPVAPSRANHPFAGVISADGAWFVCAMARRVPIVADLRTGTLITPVPGGLADQCQSLSFLDDGTLLASDGVSHSRWRPDGTLLGVVASACDAGDISGRLEIEDLPDGGGGVAIGVFDVVTHAHLGTCGERLAASGIGGAVEVSGGYHQSELSPDQRWLIASSLDATLRIHDLALDGITARIPTYHPSAQYQAWSRVVAWSACAFLPAHRCLLATTEIISDPSPTGEQCLPITGIYDLTSGKRVITLAFKDGRPVEAGAFVASHDGRLIGGIAIRFLNHTFREVGVREGRDFICVPGLWDAATGAWRCGFAAGPEPLTFSADDHLLVSATTVVDVATGAVRRRFPTPAGGKVAPLGDLIAACDRTPHGQGRLTIRSATWGTLLAATTIAFPDAEVPAPPPDSPEVDPHQCVIGAVPESPIACLGSWTVAWSPDERCLALTHEVARLIACVPALPTASRGGVTASPTDVAAAVRDLGAADERTALQAEAVLASVDESADGPLEGLLTDPAAGTDARVRAGYLLGDRVGARGDARLRTRLRAIAQKAGDPVGAAIAQEALRRGEAHDRMVAAMRTFAPDAPTPPWPPVVLREF